jgi:hypothetical protein
VNKTAGQTFLFLAAAIALPAVASLRAAPAESDRAGVEFFEKIIRPIFVEHCYPCHSKDADKVKGGLLLDTRDGLLKGGDTGPAIAVGNPEKSLLIKAVRYIDEDLAMPPRKNGGRLTDEQIADLEAWVKMGAPDPRAGAGSVAQGPPLSDPEKVRNHWAFKPIRRPGAPTVKNKRWVQNPIDAFVLAKLEEKGMTPSRQADKRTLIRRATYDLTGLPPAAQEVEDFLADTSPEAFARVVDRLLGSPRYGERWARHWLDVARYADTKGYVFEEERRYAYAYTYRDYVIRAFNEDLPFNRFIIEQLAADQLDLGDDKRPLAALGFLTLGRRFLNNQPDIIDDRIDVVSRGLLGLTVTCARCHDHKYDPIPTRDYYSLYGVFASCNEPADKPLLGTASLPRQYDEYQAERKKRENELKDFRETKENEAVTKMRQRTGDYLLTAFEGQRLKDKSKTEALARERKLDPGTVQRWISRLDEWKEQQHPIFAPWFAFAALPEQDFAAQAKTLVAKLGVDHDDARLPNPLVTQAFIGDPPGSMKDVAERYGKLFAEADKRWQELRDEDKKKSDGSGTAPAPAALPDANQEALRAVLYAESSPANLTADEIRRLFDVPTAQKLRALQRKLEELDATHPGAPPKAMVLADNSSPYMPHVFVRGNPNNPGPEVPRQFLAVVAGEGRKPFQKGSGRLELAQAIASRDNPLTARVIVNRVWLYHLGAGLVRTPSDLGLRSDPPTHPLLLDYLATYFIDVGWSLKKLHRLILLSNTYQQSSDGEGRFAQLDPDNRLLWKMNRQRLDFEEMRDSLLALAGKLDLTEGGHAVDIVGESFSPRRTIYGFVERQNLPNMFRTFDFASPDTTSPQRFATTVPQQALFLMNSPFVVQQARTLAGRDEIMASAQPEDRIRRLYEVAYQREPEPDELRLALRFVETQSKASFAPPAGPAWQYGYGQLDETAQRVKEFHLLPQFTGSAWQGGEKLPDEKVGWTMLNATGGHPGNDPQHTAIRRWTAPRDGTITIHGMLKHESESGDGVRGRIVSSRVGVVGDWTVHHDKETTTAEKVEVTRGDKIDFVVDCRGGPDSDSFSWAPKIDFTGPHSETYGALTKGWDAKEDFSGSKDTSKPLDAWEKISQVLLLSNELMFVD